MKFSETQLPYVRELLGSLAASKASQGRPSHISKKLSLKTNPYEDRNTHLGSLHSQALVALTLGTGITTRDAAVNLSYSLASHYNGPSIRWLWSVVCIRPWLFICIIHRYPCAVARLEEAHLYLATTLLSLEERP